MLRTVELHNQHSGLAQKVGDERTTRGLTPELQSIQSAVAQARP